MKYFRQENDSLLRKISLCVLTELYGGRNLPADSQYELFSSLTAVLTEQQMPSDLMTLAISLAKIVVQQDESITNQGTVLKMLLKRLIPLLSCQDAYRPLQAAIL